MYSIQDLKPVADIFHPYSDVLRDSGIPIVIDNGSCKCRVGWATDENPRLIFRNVLAKQRGKKDYETQIGNDISNIEVVRWLLKTQFDKDVITRFDIQEQVFDYIFSHLGIDTEGCVNHPLVITEALCNPIYSRQLMSELLFEGYHVPEVVYGIDSLFNFRRCTADSSRTGIVISCGYYTTQLMPVINGRPQFKHCRRINIGGNHLISFFHRLLQLKYSAHFSAITLSRVENMLHEHTYLAEDYEANILQWSELDYYENNIHKIQLPFTPIVANAISTEAQKERKQQQIRRLQEMNAKRRDEKLAVDEEKLQQLLNVRELLDEDEEDSFFQALEELSLSSVRELEDAIIKLRISIQKVKEKMMSEGKGEEVIQEPKAKKFADEFAIKSHVDVESWLTFIRQKRQEILDARVQRKQRRSDMAKRRTYASQERMKLISQLAADKKKEDNFGANDDDWEVYKTINIEGGDTDSEEEQEKLNELEDILREHDPVFIKECEEAKNVTFDLAEYYQLHIGVERARVPELLFQPSMMGIDQAGIGETLEFILSKYSPEEQFQLVQNIFVTGGCASIPGFKQRLEKILLSIRPFQTPFKVNISDDPVLGPWKGATAWANEREEMKSCVLTREEFFENGCERLKEHSCSNFYCPTPAPLPAKIIPDK
ncbi:Actin- protein 5 [Chamberlinius hualienensis]